MNKQFSHIAFENASADISCFDNGTEVKEYQVMIHVDAKRLPYPQQLEAILNAYNQLLEDQLKGAQAHHCWQPIS